LHNDEQIKNKWLKELDSLENDDADDSSQCAILGKKAPIARIHNKIKGIPGGSSMGNTLINFNNSSDESYGKEQAYNSNISVLAMKKYTEALNYLMNNKKNRTLLDNTIVVHWAMSENETYDDFFNAFIFDDKIKSTEMDDILKDMFKNVTKGVIKTDVDLINDNLDANVEYYIVGFKPNSSRLAVKFIYRQNFGNLINNLLQNVKDLSINESKSNVALWQIKKELISPNSSNEEVNPALMAKLLDSIINGTAYPEGLLDTIIRRVKTDRDDDKNSYIKMNDTRMGIIKACINRKQRQNGKKEEIKMALDVENRSEAYLCGRLFYILENVQQKASDYGLNRTIKDSYFTSASTRPATVFPKLLSLSQYHMGKKENLSYSDKEITEIVDKLGTKFPKQLTLTEQGEFMLGYYQQKAYNIKQAKEYKENKDLLKED
jgi:CRISPR-associated protein Csd1